MENRTTANQRVSSRIHVTMLQEDRHFHRMHFQNRHTAFSMTSVNMAKHDNQIPAETVRMHKADLKMGWPYKLRCHCLHQQGKSCRKPKYDSLSVDCGTFCLQMNSGSVCIETTDVHERGGDNEIQFPETLINRIGWYHPFPSPTPLDSANCFDKVPSLPHSNIFLLLFLSLVW